MEYHDFYFSTASLPVLLDEDGDEEEDEIRSFRHFVALALLVRPSDSISTFCSFSIGSTEVYMRVISVSSSQASTNIMLFAAAFFFLEPQPPTPPADHQAASL